MMQPSHNDAVRSRSQHYALIGKGGIKHHDRLRPIIKGTANIMVAGSHRYVPTRCA